MDNYKFSKSERYIAFLMTYLPRLATVALYKEDEKIAGRGIVLSRTLDYLPKNEGVCLEFGVFRGESINYCAKRFPNRVFYGFDSFQGFPEDGRSDWNQDFSVSMTPNIPANVQLYKGWFKDTLPQFIAENDRTVDFINIDCDLYSSTHDVFSQLSKADILKPNVIIYFDELINYSRYIWNESLALFEILEETGLGMTWICAHKNVRYIEETINLLASQSHPTWDQDLRSGFHQQASLILNNDGLDLSILHLNHMKPRIAKMAEKFDSMISVDIK